MIEMFIPDSAFQPGGLFEGQNPAKVSVVASESFPATEVRERYVIKKNPLVLDDTKFESQFRASREIICYYVAIGAAVVRHNGTALTPQEIRDFHF